MDKRGNTSAIVLTFLFIVFALFMMYKYDGNTTGYITANFNSPDKFYINQKINGSAVLNIASNDKIKNDTEFRLGIYGMDNVQYSLQKLTADEIFNKTFFIEKKNEGNDYFFDKTGGYIFYLNNFSLTYNQVGQYKLRLMKKTLTGNVETLVEKDISLVEGQQITNTIERIELLGLKIDDDEFTTFGPDFKIYDYIGCNVKFKFDIPLDVQFYSPILTEPYKEFKDIVHLSNNDIACDQASSECLVALNVTVSQKGKWKCFAKQGESTNSSNFMYLVGGSPILKYNIPDFSVSKIGEFNSSIDLDDYFDDPDGDKLQYNVIGNKHLIISVQNNGKLVIGNSKGYEGVENILFRAFDGSDGVFSNTVKITVGSGQENSPSGCYPIWDCEIWSECISGVRTRNCNDKNNCDNDVSKPLLSEECYQDNNANILGDNQQREVEEQKIEVAKPLVSGNLRYGLFGVLIAALLVMGGFLLYWFKFKKNKNVQKNIQNTQTVNTQQNKLDEVKNYVSTMLQRGENQNKIKTDLINAGWNKNDVNNIVNYFVLKNFIKNKLDSGFTKEKIVQSLVEKGWKKEMIDAILIELKA